MNPQNIEKTLFENFVGGSISPAERGEHTMFGGYLQWNACTFFQKILAAGGIVMSSWSKTFQTFWSHSSVFALEKQHKNLNFQSFLPLRHFGCHFRWNECTYFEKMCSLIRYSNARLIKNISDILVALLRFCFQKTTLKYKFSEFFYF